MSMKNMSMKTKLILQVVDGILQSYAMKYFEKVLQLWFVAGLPVVPCLDLLRVNE